MRVLSMWLVTLLLRDCRGKNEKLGVCPCWEPLPCALVPEHTGKGFCVFLPPPCLVAATVPHMLTFGTIFISL